ncbi:MAG: MobF family relaxase [Acidimicrobiales bacterium]
MMSRGKITPGSLSYYTDIVAPGVEDYYAGRGEAPGVWLGSGARAAGIDCEVSAVQLQRLFAQHHPVTGEMLGAEYVVPDGRDKVYGWDLTCSAPKTVSTLWAVGGGTVGMEVRDAHDAAIGAAIAYLEEHAAFGREGKAGIRQVDTDGLVIAGFVHRTSRNGDPQLHTHLLVGNRVRCATDGEWRALDSRALHPQIKPSGVVYQAALRAELTRRLGVAWGPVSVDGQAEIIGVPEPLREAWSSRRRHILAVGRDRIAAREAELGRSLTTVERRIELERAVLDDRPSKDLDGVSDEGLHDQWARDAERLGHPAVSWISDTLHHAQPRLEVDPVQVALDAVADLEREHSTWTRAELVKQISRRAPTGLPDADAARRWVEHTTDFALSLTDVLAIAAPEPAPPASLQRRDGRSMYDPHNATKYTTSSTVEVEQRVLDHALAGRGAGMAVAAVSHVEDSVVMHGLDDGQADTVRRLTTDGDAVAVVVGPAGAGKSRTMGAAADAWQRAGIAVRGVALSATAAGVLASEAGIRADTIAKLLHEHDRPDGPGPDWQLRRGEVVIVDEAGMVSSRDLARLVALAEHATAKVVLVGDYAQLDAIDSGGLFRLLAPDLHAAELGTLHRFANRWEAGASLALRSHDPTCLRVYAEHGRIGAGDRLAIIDDAVTRWHDARSAGESVIVCARDRGTVADINNLVRHQRTAAGEVAADGLELADETTIGVGDEVVTLRNDRTLLTSRGGWVRNGDRWTVHTVHPHGAVTLDDLTGRGRTTLPADYVGEHVALGYALTIHKAQGVTVDRSVLVVDPGLTAEALYVGMTRGRQDNTALVITDPLNLDHHGREEPVDPVRVLADVLRRDTHERAAVEEIRHVLERSESLAVLKPRLANLDRWLRDNSPADHSIDLERARRRLAAAEQAMRPGRLTRRGRHDRNRLDQLAARVEELAAHETARAAWHDQHADTFSYRDELAKQIEKRRLELGRQAAVDQPEHLTRILGACPDQYPARSRWILAAANIEAYREEWDVAPADLHRSPIDGVQHREWSRTVDVPRRLEALTRPPTPRTQGVEEPAVERGFGIEL